MSLINFNYNGKVISQRKDGFINATQMCTCNSRRLDNWLRLKATSQYIQELENSLTSEVVVTYEGNSENSGTWVHPTLAINLARWISPQFAVWCDSHIFNLLDTGSTKLNVTSTQLNPKELVQTAKDLETINNLTLQELLRNELIDYLSVKQGKKSLSSSDKKEYTIAKVRAKELGYSTKDIGKGSGLGRYISSRLDCAFSERVGKYEVKHYLINPQLDNCIHAYFNSKKGIYLI